MKSMVLLSGYLPYQRKRVVDLLPPSSIDCAGSRVLAEYELTVSMPSAIASVIQPRRSP